MYIVSMKEGISGSMGYGRSTYDFDEGVMLFIAPGQVVVPGDTVIDNTSKGWSLLFHPDLIRRTSLGQKINQYSFFSYDVNEALHLSDDEIQTLTELVQKITKELEQRIDKHTENLISGNIELLLDYCTRFYDRQFYTRSNHNKDSIVEFESFLRDYFQSDEVIQNGIPSVAYCGKELGISPNYLSDLLKKETGKTAKEHIQLFLIERAKNKLLGSDDSISRIAFDLGFDYPAHFTKVFRKTTGYSPSEFRKLN
ncbi:helix-turn-helix domain-containing protein [Vibrio sp. HN007]|uniref:helix-turn-helix domain-containing protein n=1 Tax=Vibrio iocasae TaxID=3098914 RepID=UPI0035D3DF81